MSNKIDRTVFPQSYSIFALLSIIYTVVVLNLFFPEYHTPIPIFFLILISAILFFFFLHTLSIRWMSLNRQIFYRHIFISALFVRFFYMGVLYFYTWLYFPQHLPLEYNPSDAERYLVSGNMITGEIFNGEFISILDRYWRSTADWGYPFFLGLINTFVFKSIIVAKLVNIFLGALTVLILTKTVELLYNIQYARFIGIVLMLLPSLNWNNSFLLKETLMIFLMSLVVYNSIKIVKSHSLHLGRLIIIISAISSFFYLRTAMAVLLFLSVAVYFILNLTKAKERKMGLAVSILMIFAGVYGIADYSDELFQIQEQYSNIENIGEASITNKISSGEISLATQVALPLLTINSIISPYPTVLNMDERQLAILLNAHNEFVRIILYYFCLLGIFLTIKRDFRNSSLILMIALGYLMIVIIGAKAYEARFQLPSVPFLLILGSYGYFNASERVFKGFKYYVVIIMIVTIVWHLFKLNIRGL